MSYVPESLPGPCSIGEPINVALVGTRRGGVVSTPPEGAEGRRAADVDPPTGVRFSRVVLLSQCLTETCNPMRIRDSVCATVHACVVVVLGVVVVVGWGWGATAAAAAAAASSWCEEGGVGSGASGSGDAGNGSRDAAGAIGRKPKVTSHKPRAANNRSAVHVSRKLEAF